MTYQLYGKANPNALETNWNVYLCFNRPFCLVWRDLAQTPSKSKNHKMFQKQGFGDVDRHLTHQQPPSC